MPKYDATQLLYKRSEKNRFLNELDIPERHTKTMLAARVLVRNKIKSAFTKARTDERLLATLNEDQRHALQSIEPRFKSQGSFVYGTQNMPAKNPPQQIDLDDGTYLPIEAMREAPILNKEIFFGIVDKALNELAYEQSWKFTTKDTCARLEITSEIHLDVPLYAIPKERFQTLEKAMGRAVILDESHTFTESKKYLEDDEIYLARRDTKHWVKSDPIQIYNWFIESIETHGEILRRVCRYLKAWRDQEWASGGPSSIALMICATNVFDENIAGFDNDSAAIAAVFNRLTYFLNKGVKNPRDKEETIFPRGISNNEIKIIITKTQQAAVEINKVLNNGVSPSEVIKVFQQHFSLRIPNRTDWVKHIGTATSAAAAVLTTPVRKTSTPNVPSNMTAG